MKHNEAFLYFIQAYNDDIIIAVAGVAECHYFTPCWTMLITVKPV